MVKGVQKAALIKGIDDLLDADELREIAVDRIRRDSDQPRKVFPEEQLQELADSIKARGVRQPIIVYEEENGFLLEDGERRWRATQMAGVATIPAIVRKHPASDSDRHDNQLLSFFSREDLNPVEMAEALEKAIQRHGSAEALRAHLGVSKTWISRRRAIGKLPQEVKALAVDGVVTDQETLIALGKIDPAERKAKVEGLRNGDLKNQDILQGHADKLAEKNRAAKKKDGRVKAAAKPQKISFARTEILEFLSALRFDMSSEFAESATTDELKAALRGAILKS